MLLIDHELRIPVKVGSGDSAKEVKKIRLRVPTAADLEKFQFVEGTETYNIELIAHLSDREDDHIRKLHGFDYRTLQDSITGFLLHGVVEAERKKMLQEKLEELEDEAKAESREPETQETESEE